MQEFPEGRMLAAGGPNMRIQFREEILEHLKIPHQAEGFAGFAVCEEAVDLFADTRDRGV